ncbi:TetR/AcrR family transcriptional regulator [Congregibacter sp.]|uniref:TetR/AcrR family transcriptional regulator n=1 Tax=Congregibacter sp. TaxID=2744308 RepID=UPI003859ECFA
MTQANTVSSSRNRTLGPKDQSHVSTADGRLNRAQNRRRRIFRALHDCIIETGYSNTTLAHIAKRADMSPSHLLYYFQGKERILEEYFDNVSQWFLARIAEISEEPVEERIFLLSELWFEESEDAYADIGFMLECFGEAVHDGVMRQTKSQFDRSCKESLELMLSQHSLRDGISPAQAAEIGYALLIGLRNSAYFDNNVTLSEAANSFLAAIRNLQNTDP